MAIFIIQSYVVVAHAFLSASGLSIGCPYAAGFNRAFAPTGGDGMLWMLLGLAVGAGFVGLQTCIVIRRTPDFIIAAADSKSSSARLEKDEQATAQHATGARTIRKINYANRIYFAASGIGRIAGFDVDALAAQACGEAASIEEAAENFKRNGGEPLGSALAFVRTHWPDYFQRRAVDAEALKIAFFGMERGAPTLVALTFEALITSDTAFQLMHKILSCPGTIPADKSVDLLFGQTAASAGEMAKPSWRTSPIPAFRRLILAEAKARPDTVAPPIDILRIDALGPHWIK